MEREARRTAAEIVPAKVRKNQLSSMERRFAQEYLIDLNARKAAIRAGYSVGTAREASRWIKSANPEKPQLAAYIEALMAQRARRTGVNAERVVRELARIAFANITDVADPETGKVRADADREEMAAVESISVQTGKIERNEVRLANKLKAMELLGRHMGMFADSLQIAGEVPVIIDDSGAEAHQ